MSKIRSEVLSPSVDRRVAEDSWILVVVEHDHRVVAIEDSWVAVVIVGNCRQRNRAVAVGVLVGSCC